MNEMNYKKIKITQELERLTDQELLLAIWQVILTLPQATKEILRDKQISEFKNYTVTDWENFTTERFLCQGLRMLCEFAKRYNKCPDLPLGVVCSSKVIGEYMIEKLSGVKQEMLIGVYLDTKNQLLAEKKIFVGTLDSATVHPREIFKYAFSYSTARFIVVHNHPSGQVSPSANDLAVTKRLATSGELLGITLLDHIIVGKDAYFSFRENKILKK